MIEAPTDTRTRDAMRAAHACRGAAFASLWHKLFTRTSR